jgi:tubulin-specific chaperone D
MRAVRILPIDVFLLEPVLSAISTPNLLWQTKYILLLWLSLICLAPFDLASIESHETSQSLVTRLLKVSEEGLGVAGKERDACAILCARVLSRSDVWRTELHPFMTRAIDVFQSPGDNILLVNTLVWLYELTKKTGLLSAIANILAHSAREIGESIIPQSLRILHLTQSEDIQSNAVARKLRVKIMQRIGMLGIPHVKSAAFEVSESLEEVLDSLLSALSDKDTIVRYTAAKAVSRIVLALPSEFADEIIPILFQKMDDGLIKSEKEWDFSSVDENIWHGCLLCLADIAWNSGLLASTLEPTITYSLNVPSLIVLVNSRHSRSISSKARNQLALQFEMQHVTSSTPSLEQSTPTN